MLLTQDLAVTSELHQSKSVFAEPQCSYIAQTPTGLSLFVFVQSLRIKLALPQSAWLSIFLEKSLVLRINDGLELRMHY